MVKIFKSFKTWQEQCLDKGYTLRTWGTYNSVIASTKEGKLAGEWNNVGDLHNELQRGYLIKES